MNRECLYCVFVVFADPVFFSRLVRFVCGEQRQKHSPTQNHTHTIIHGFGYSERCNSRCLFKVYCSQVFRSFFSLNIWLFFYCCSSRFSSYSLKSPVFAKRIRFPDHTYLVRVCHRQILTNTDVRMVLLGKQTNEALIKVFLSCRCVHREFILFCSVRS